EGVHVVEGAALGQTLGQSRAGDEADLVPADVRQLQRAALKLAHLAADHAQARRAALLGRALEAKLHAKADSEDGSARGETLAQELVQAELPQPGHAARKGSHPRHDKAGRGTQALVA